VVSREAKASPQRAPPGSVTTSRCTPLEGFKSVRGPREEISAEEGTKKRDPRRSGSRRGGKGVGTKGKVFGEKAFALEIISHIVKHGNGGERRDKRPRERPL